MKSGLLLIDKPGGMSSAAVVGRLKKRLGLQKIGHAGTLDPMATGLLVCLVNSATRLADFAEKGRKLYQGTIRFGVTTNTNDIEGKILTESSDIPTFEEIKIKASKYVGLIDQVPPQVSAIKVQGQRAYKMVLRGEEPKLNSRKVNVYTFLVKELVGNEVSFEIECSPGTYIRAIARDLGEDLGCGASLSSLRRAGSFPFKVEQAVKLDDATDQDILPWESLFPHVVKLELDSPQAQRLYSGDMKSVRTQLQKIVTPKEDQDILIYIDRETKRPLGLLRSMSGVWEIGVNIY